MSESRQNKILIQLLVQHLLRQGIPRMLQLKEKLTRGEPLSEFDITFLNQMISESTRLQVLVAKQPQYHSLIGRMAELYREITQRALDNEPDT